MPGTIFPCYGWSYTQASFLKTIQGLFVPNIPWLGWRSGEQLFLPESLSCISATLIVFQLCPLSWYSSFVRKEYSWAHAGQICIAELQKNQLVQRQWTGPVLQKHSLHIIWFLCPVSEFETVVLLTTSHQICFTADSLWLVNFMSLISLGAICKVKLNQ